MKALVRMFAATFYKNGINYYGPPKNGLQGAACSDVSRLPFFWRLAGEIVTNAFIVTATRSCMWKSPHAAPPRREAAEKFLDDVVQRESV